MARLKSKAARTPNMPMPGPIEELPPALLKPHAQNARADDERQIVLIVQSTKTFGFPKRRAG